VTNDETKKEKKGGKFSFSFGGFKAGTTIENQQKKKKLFGYQEETKGGTSSRV